MTSPRRLIDPTRDFNGMPPPFQCLALCLALLSAGAKRNPSGGGDIKKASIGRHKV